MTTDDGGLPTAQSFVRQLVVSSGVAIPTLVPTLVYLRRLKLRLPPKVKRLPSARKSTGRMPPSLSTELRRFSYVFIRLDNSRFDKDTLIRASASSRSSKK